MFFNDYFDFLFRRKRTYLTHILTVVSVTKTDLIGLPMC